MGNSYSQNHQPVYQRSFYGFRHNFDTNNTNHKDTVANNFVGENTYGTVSSVTHGQHVLAT